MKKILFILGGIFFLSVGFVSKTTVEQSPLQLALLKYSGGGDWYSNPTALPNLAKFCNQTLGTDLDADYATVEVGSAEIFNLSLIHI